MDVPDFVPREPHHILLKIGNRYYVMDDDSWKPKRNRQELEREGFCTEYVYDILDHGHWLTYRSLWTYDLRHDLIHHSITPGMIFEDKCIYCEAAEHGIISSKPKNTRCLQ